MLRHHATLVSSYLALIVISDFVLDTQKENSGGTDFAVTGTLQVTTPLKRFGYGRMFLNMGVGANIDKGTTSHSDLNR